MVNLGHIISYIWIYTSTVTCCNSASHVKKGRCVHQLGLQQVSPKASIYCEPTKYWVTPGITWLGSKAEWDCRQHGMFNRAVHLSPFTSKQPGVGTSGTMKQSCNNFIKWSITNNQYYFDFPFTYFPENRLNLESIWFMLWKHRVLTNQNSCDGQVVKPHNFKNLMVAKGQTTRLQGKWWTRLLWQIRAL